MLNTNDRILIESISGRIDFREFLIGLGILNSQEEQDRDAILKLAFKMFDVQGSGRVQLEFLRRACMLTRYYILIAITSLPNCTRIL
jgi:Ca2+-binding EF-hand superfamily protein